MSIAITIYYHLKITISLIWFGTFRGAPQRNIKLRNVQFRGLGYFQQAPL